MKSSASHRRAKARWLVKWKRLTRTARDKPCSRCGNRYPLVCMDFHHRDPTEKEFAILAMPMGLKRTAAEIAKCDVVCANCHRIIHEEDRGKP